MAVSIAVLTVPFIFVIIIIWLSAEEKRKRNQLQADLYAKAIEMGQSVPQDLFVKPKSGHNSLKIGFIFMTIGIGTSLAIWLMSVIRSSSPPASSKEGLLTPLLELQSRMEAKVIFSYIPLGIIPFLVGIAFVIIYFLEKKQSTNDNAK